MYNVNELKEKIGKVLIMRSRKLFAKSINAFKYKKKPEANC